MGASSSTPSAPTVQAQAMMASPPQGCPMHQEAKPVTGMFFRREVTLAYHCTFIAYHCHLVTCLTPKRKMGTSMGTMTERK